MATVSERVSVLETKVDNFGEKLDEVKVDVKESHTDIKEQLKTMYDASCSQHAELASKIKDLEGFKMKWSYMALGGLAVMGWVTGHIEQISTFLK
jgi:SMC interacting uncharacterized protein involved in chromosome segregation